jgi:hypothetical protein
MSGMGVNAGSTLVDFGRGATEGTRYIIGFLALAF